MKYYDDDYDGRSFEKFTHRKSKKHKKGHQSRSANSEKYQWAQIIENENSMEIEVLPVSSAPQGISVTLPPATSGHQFGENTHEIKGVKIDFDGVADITKVENKQNNITTYGIKFLFKGKKGLYRVIWYNTNLRARDASFNIEYAFWLSINK